MKKDLFGLGGCLSIVLLCYAPAAANATDGQFVHTMRSDSCILTRKPDPEKAGFVPAALAAPLTKVAITAVAGYVYDAATNALTPDVRPTALSATDYDTYLFTTVKDKHGFKLIPNSGFGCFTTIMDSLPLPPNMPSVLDESIEPYDLKANLGPFERLKKAGFSWSGLDSAKPREPSLIFEARLNASDDGTALYLQGVYYWQQRWFSDKPFWDKSTRKLSLENEFFGTSSLTITYLLNGPEVAPYLSASFDLGKVNIDPKTSQVSLRGKSSAGGFNESALSDIVGFRTPWLPMLAATREVRRAFFKDMRNPDVVDKEGREYMPAALETSIRIEPDPNKTLLAISGAMTAQRKEVLEAISSVGEASVESTKADIEATTLEVAAQTALVASLEDGPEKNTESAVLRDLQRQLAGHYSRLAEQTRE